MPTRFPPDRQRLPKSFAIDTYRGSLRDKHTHSRTLAHRFTHEPAHKRTRTNAPARSHPCSQHCLSQEHHEYGWAGGHLVSGLAHHHHHDGSPRQLGGSSAISARVKPVHRSNNLRQHDHRLPHRHQLVHGTAHGHWHVVPRRHQDGRGEAVHGGWALWRCSCPPPPQLAGHACGLVQN